MTTPEQRNKKQVKEYFKRVHEETHAGEEAQAECNAERALHWRRDIAQLSVLELAALTGYSATAIYRLEYGYNSLGRPFQHPVWTRYFKALPSVAEVLIVEEP